VDTMSNFSDFPTNRDSIWDWPDRDSRPVLADR
jgi:hypothetical protein